MKFLLTLTLLFSLNIFAEELDENCEYPIIEPILEVGAAKMINQVSTAVKRDFKRRPMNVKDFNLALNIETNFEAPLIGKDPYWGRIYFKDGDDQNITYRDDLIAEENYNDELKKPALFNYSKYKVSDINSSKGLSLIKAAGAEVNVKSTDEKFSIKTGGRLTIRVKAPSENPYNLSVDVVRAGKNVSKFLLIAGKRIPFDNFKINASKNFLGVTTILSGIDTIQFYSGGKVVHSIKQ